MTGFIIACVFAFSPPPQYAQVFGSDYTAALSFYGTRKPECKALANQYGQDAEVMTAVVFPEWIRYAYFSDFFETEALSLVYTEYGASAADFSVGYCQMKPSFVEKIEAELEKNVGLKEKYKALLTTGEIVERRKQRLANLGSFLMQWTYLCCFMEITEAHFPFITAFSPEEKIRFCATVYNSGWGKSRETLEKQMTVASYPYGSRFPESIQYRYCEISVDFWKNKD